MGLWGEPWECRGCKAQQLEEKVIRLEERNKKLAESLMYAQQVALKAFELIPSEDHDQMQTEIDFLHIAIKEEKSQENPGL